MLFTQLLAMAAAVAAITPITTKGNAFFAGNDRFYMRGLDYQPGGSSKLTDPLADDKTCDRDIPYFKELGINTIRVYSVDNTKQHDHCMKALADAGIYVIVDVNTPKQSISRDHQAECSYNTAYLEQVFATMIEMERFDNTLGFFAANEVINDDSSTAAALYVKAVVRDMKTFLKNRKMRQVPVGYSAADVEENRLESANYFNCGDDEMARVDMFGFNDYSWCNDASFESSGYKDKVKQFGKYSLPLFFSEYGCNKGRPKARPFTEVEAIFSTKMSSVFSGGLVYEYSTEENDYGLVKIDGDDIETSDDYDNLKKEFEKTANMKGDGGYQSDLPHSDCPKVGKHWNATDDIPDTPKGALKWINDKANPNGEGFKAETQWKCYEKGNDVDDSDSASKSSTSVKPGSTGSSSGSDSDSTESGSDKKNAASSMAPFINSALLLGVAAGVALI
ncbi:1,3-beta-glucanosyltransferase Pga4p [Diutina catenulata]